MFSITSQLTSFRFHIPPKRYLIFVWPLLCLLWMEGTAQTADSVVASVNGRPIVMREVDDSISAQIYPVQQQIYAMRKSALENLIVSRLLDEAARKRGVSVDTLRKQFTAGEVVVTAAQVEESFATNASYFVSMSPDEAKERLRLDLENRGKMKFYRTALEELRSSASISVDLKPPFFSNNNVPIRGSTKPQVTIVEFSDFECPYCREVQPTLKQILKTYSESVQLIFKHLPLEGHRHSLLAAKSAICAGEQEKFWEFHDAMFQSQNLTSDEINRVVTTLKLDSKTYSACVASDRVKAAIAKDLNAAQELQIDGTPGFVINGKVYRGALSLAALQEIVERELNQGLRATSSSSN